MEQRRLVACIAMTVQQQKLKEEQIKNLKSKHIIKIPNPKSDIELIRPPMLSLALQQNDFWMKIFNLEIYKLYYKKFEIWTNLLRIQFLHVKHYKKSLEEEKKLKSRFFEPEKLKKNL